VELKEKTPNFKNTPNNTLGLIYLSKQPLIPGNPACTESLSVCGSHYTIS